MAVEQQEGRVLASHWEDLEDGDYVVDEQHGIGIYRGLTTLAKPTTEGAEPLEREYLVLEFAAGDRVYVPAEQADRVRRYVGGEGGAPTLSRLKGRSWTTAIAKARQQARDAAADLVALYAERQAARGHAYAVDTAEQAAMEAAFPHTETPDQNAAIRDVKQDLERPRPMDRLIVGDVGYGKTEVAVRAAFKVAQEGRQVAVLCPTSVLAAQHQATFCERLSPFGVRVAMLSRFQSSGEQQEVLERLASGAVQVVIGTHRLLSDDVRFQQLGLVIVDEEQRFGVAHKEKLKQMRATVDVLTMTATPIPRTLQMSLAGLRDMSPINDPPEGRAPVETTVGEYNERVIREAISRELAREGQVYFLHNRVETIETVAAGLRELVPEARIGVAHGQMDEATLEQTMTDFYERRFDVLVCTTIVESGVDIPNANTLIVNDADQLGLAQLYQLRGRVGRSERQAYAFFFYHDPAGLTEIARRRLATLEEFSELGAGQKIALRDLELRGAGSLLGLEQSGPVAAVGLDLYLRLLESAVRRVRGEKPNPRMASLPAVDLPVPFGLPPSYVRTERERLELYNKMTSVRSVSEIAGLRAELEQRYGPPPVPVENALTLLALRLRCRAAGVRTITSEGGRLSLLLRKGALPSSTAEHALRGRLGDQVVSVTEDRAVLSVPPTEALAAAQVAMDAFAHAVTARRRRTASTAARPGG